MILRRPCCECVASPCIQYFHCSLSEPCLKLYCARRARREGGVKAFACFGVLMVIWVQYFVIGLQVTSCREGTEVMECGSAFSPPRSRQKNDAPPSAARPSSLPASTPQSAGKADFSPLRLCPHSNTSGMHSEPMLWHMDCDNFATSVAWAKFPSMLCQAVNLRGWQARRLHVRHQPIEPDSFLRHRTLRQLQGETVLVILLPLPSSTDSVAHPNASFQEHFCKISSL